MVQSRQSLLQDSGQLLHRGVYKKDKPAHKGDEKQTDYKENNIQASAWQIFAFLLIVSFLKPVVAKAWNTPGHKLSALIAYQLLKQESPQTIDKVKAVLASHPWRSNQWQRVLDPLPDADRDVVLFMLAARWADDIRTQGTVENRPLWHYINLPFKPEDQPANIWTKPPGVPNILTALSENREIVAVNPSPEQRAIALAWLIHLVGDVHPPLHAIQLFSVNYPNGDRGGNEICIRPKPGGEPLDLHKFWDDLVTRTERVTVLQRLATSLKNRPEFSKSNLTELKATEFAAWGTESFDSARVAAYLSGALTGVPKNQNRDCRDVQAAPALPSGYITTAKRIADRRMILAGYRLADLLSGLLDVK